MNLDQIAGVAHQPAGPPHGVVVLTHGAGGSRESTLLQQVCAEWTRRGWLAVRYNLPYRRRRPTGPPSGSGSGDRAGIVEAIQLCRGLAEGPLIAGGHSYGGRQTSMVVAAGQAPVDVLTLFSYPVHPPGKPERVRTEHLPGIAVPTVFTHGTAARSARWPRCVPPRRWSRHRPRSSRSPAPDMTWARRPSMSPGWRSMRRYVCRRAK